jgi:hypothetical protein
MVGVTQTAISPEDAPPGIVIVIEVLLHELTVAVAPFKVTIPVVEPKSVPERTSWLPTEAVVEESAVMLGAGATSGLTETLSNVAVAVYVVPPLATASPTYTFCAIVTD